LPGGCGRELPGGCGRELPGGCGRELPGGCGREFLPEYLTCAARNSAPGSTPSSWLSRSRTV
jgi:hypothetical protein